MPPKKVITPGSDGNAGFVFDDSGFRLLIQEVQEDMKRNFKQLSEDLSSFKEEFRSEFVLLKNSVETLTKQNDEKDKVIAALTAQVNSIDQYSRNKNIELENVAVSDGEDVEQLVLNVSNQLGIQLDPIEIDAVHRLPSKFGNRPPKIIVQFTTRKKRDLFLKNKKKVITNAQITGLNRDSGNRIYINENLSPHYRELFWKTKTKAKEVGYKFVWCVQGKIFVRKEEGSPVVKIHTFADVEKIKT
jgi:Baculovirus FP protein